MMFIHLGILFSSVLHICWKKSVDPNFIKLTLHYYSYQAKLKKNWPPSKMSTLTWLISFNILDQMGIPSSKQVVRICEKAVRELKEYCNKTKNNEQRFTSLLLRLSPLRSLQPDVLEELFFAGLIGNVQIDSVVPYILKMESSEYKSSQNAQGAANVTMTGKYFWQF